jgi:hypothetical protein
MNWAGSVVQGVQHAGQQIGREAGQLSDAVAKDAKRALDQLVRGIESTWKEVEALAAVAERLLFRKPWQFLYLTKPHVRWCYPDPPEPGDTTVYYAGEDLYYVNGMLTDLGEALGSAKLIANELHRPVGLIFNSSGHPDTTLGNEGRYLGIPLDLLVSAYDRTKNVFPLGNNLGLIGEWDCTTRQVNYLFLEAARAGRTISIISYSQGCLIVRNAVLEIGWLFGQHSFIRHHLAWVAAAPPFCVRVELLAKLARFRAVVVGDDAVARALGMNGGQEGFPSFSPHTLEGGNYWALLNSDWLFP